MLDWINNAVLGLGRSRAGLAAAAACGPGHGPGGRRHGAIIVFSRCFTTDQDLLRRCDQDKQRLKELIREAKRRKDKEAVAALSRHAEHDRHDDDEAGRLAVAGSILPIAVLGTWCFQRLAFVPPQAGQSVPVKAIFRFRRSANWPTWCRKRTSARCRGTSRAAAAIGSRRS